MPPSTPNKQIAEARAALNHDLTRGELEDVRDRSFIVTRMNLPDVKGSLRSEFKSMFGHPDELTGDTMHQARIWVEKATVGVEPF